MKLKSVGDEIMPGKLHTNKALCIALNEAIKDERKAPKEYQELLRDLDNAGQLSSGREYELRSIINQEKSHERKFIKMAAEIGCSIE